MTAADETALQPESVPAAAIPAVEANELAETSIRYKPMQLPSAPFWLMLIGAVIFLTIIAATWSVVFMFAIGLALFVLLLPIVNWLSRRGVPRGLASLGVVALMVISAILVGDFRGELLLQPVPAVPWVDPPRRWLRSRQSLQIGLPAQSRACSMP